MATPGSIRLPRNPVPRDGQRLALAASEARLVLADPGASIAIGVVAVVAFFADVEDPVAAFQLEDVGRAIIGSLMRCSRKGRVPAERHRIAQGVDIRPIARQQLRPVAPDGAARPAAGEGIRRTGERPAARRTGL